MFVIALNFFPGPKYMYLYYVIYADRKCFSRARAQEPFLKKNNTTLNKYMNVLVTSSSDRTEYLSNYV